ncbi:nitrilase-related carbon-nitrogen hydrolase [Cryobacterium ruanii]|uniref:CN hydrolase domain-containing protein n=1 Tax=Cryobacterium ruanii TaxID=1259197 RepID=A0A4V3ITK9_9MICO|nr:nitrilase-related carbon-nitrogen hydrolase [Cryobacterium ruanii]TFD67721.1 hypothetical protein E3T47_03590 [Cryobacterium ruanii]
MDAPNTHVAADRTTRVRCHELAPIAGDFLANVAIIEAAILDAQHSGVQLLVLPELATSGYYLTADEARACAISADAALFNRWARMLSPDAVIVVGFVETDGTALYNSVAVLTEAGPLAVYRKTHLWDSEVDLFLAGTDPAPVVDTPLGKLGILICYDLEFPEMPRNLALRGAEIIAVPTNWPLVPRPNGEHPPEVVQAMAAARASSVAIICCDRSGVERGNEWTQGTAIVGPDGWRRGLKDENGVLESSVTIGARRTQIGPRNNVMTDRRPELYF